MVQSPLRSVGRLVPSRRCRATWRLEDKSPYGFERKPDAAGRQELMTLGCQESKDDGTIGALLDAPFADAPLRQPTHWRQRPGLIRLGRAPSERRLAPLPWPRRLW